MRCCPIIEQGCECGRPHYARGWCAMHYGRWRTTGDPLATKTVPHGLPPLQRFMRYVTVDAIRGCWIWTGTSTTGGYGQWQETGAPAPVGAHPTGLSWTTSCASDLAVSTRPTSVR